MRNLLPIFTAFIILSCNEDEIIVPVENQTVKQEVYLFSQNVSILDYNYYKGPDGKEYQNEAESFFKNTWSFYDNPSIISVELKKDSVIINEMNAISKYKSTLEQDYLYIDQHSKKVLLGRIDKKNKAFYLYKNYEAYSVVDPVLGGFSFGKKSDLGKITKEDIFPRIIAKPEDLTQNGEYVFWNNIEYKYIK